MLTPVLLKRLTDIAIIMAVIAALSFVIIATGNSLVAKSTLARSYSMWLAFVTRPDIIVTSLIAIIATMAVSHYGAGGRR